MNDVYARFLERVRRQAALEACEQEDALARVVGALGARVERLAASERSGDSGALRERVAALRQWRDELAGVLEGVTRGRAERRRRETDALLDRCRRLAAELERAGDRELVFAVSAELGLHPPLSERSLDAVRDLAASGAVETWRSRTAALLAEATRPPAPAPAPAPPPTSPRVAAHEARLALLGVTPEVLRALAALSASQLEELLEAFLRRRAQDAALEAGWQLPADPLAEAGR